MSTQLMDLDTAQQHLVNTLRGPAVIERLQAHGITVPPEKVAHFLEMADLMNRARQVQMAKQASRIDVDDDLAYLRGMLGVKPQRITADHPVFKQAGAESCQDPATYNALLSIVTAEAVAN
jgi:hypothetical protein